MSDKTRRTVTIKEENDEWLAQRDNASATVDQILDQARRTGDIQNAALDLQIKQKERTVEDQEDRLESLKRDIEELKELRRVRDKREDAELAEAREALKDTPKEPTNAAIKTWAQDLGLEPEELIQELQ